MNSDTSNSQSYMTSAGMMADSNSPQVPGGAYGPPTGIPSYVHENYENSRSPAGQINENYNYNYNGVSQVKSENYGPQINNDTYNYSEQPPQAVNPYESSDSQPVPSQNYVSQNPQEAPLKTESYSENQVKSEVFGSNDLLPVKKEPYWSNSSGQASHNDVYNYGSPQPYRANVSQEYPLSMPQDYLRSAATGNNMVGATNESASYENLTNVKSEMDLPSNQVQTTMSLPSHMYPQASSSPHNKLYEQSMALPNPGYRSPVSPSNPMYNPQSMSSQNHMYNQASMSSHHASPYQSSMSSPYPPPSTSSHLYQPHAGTMYDLPNMSSNGHLYQNTLPAPNNNYSPYQQYQMSSYSNSNPYHHPQPSSSSYSSYVPQNPWNNFTTGFPPGADTYPDSIGNCSPKKKSKLNHSKGKPVQIVSQQHFHSKRGIYLFQMREMNPASPMFSISDHLLMIEKQLCENLIRIDLPDNVCYVYNPLEYAFTPHRIYTEKYCNTQKQILFLGMNPGPFGMSQNGVPFGEYNIVRDWLKVTGEVAKPLKEHPKRLIVGLDCKRSEVTGSRFWGYFRRLCGTPENFFRHCFVYNICPMAFMSDTGKNITPPQIPTHVLKAINNVCNNSLIEVIQLLNVKTVIGVGNYAYNSAQKLLSSANMEHIKVHVIMHPSPINPAANKGWDNIARDQLKNIGILELLQGNNTAENNHELS